MKRLFSLFTLLTFFVIGFIHSSMMLFAMDINYPMVEMKSGNNALCCDLEIQNNDNCMDNCCIEQQIDHGAAGLNNNFQKKIIKTVIKNNYTNIFDEGLYLLNNKSLINKTSPPFVNTEITNYSYHTLVKIIKSNT